MFSHYVASNSSVTPWTVALQALSSGILQARILEWVSISSSRGSSWLRDRTCISCIFCIGRQILYDRATWEAKEPGGLQPMGSQRVGHNWATSLSLFTLMNWRRKWHPTPVENPRDEDSRLNLENPRDGGAWWAAVYGVTQSRTQLKRLSSSSSS